MKPIAIGRRDFLGILGGAALGASVDALGCGSYGMQGIPVTRGADFLVRRQSPDGAWRSTHYGFFRDGDALTPLVLATLFRCPQSAGVANAMRRGTAWLDSLTDRLACCSAPSTELRYPLFTASYAARYYAARGDARAAIWANCIEALQLTSRLGWSSDDPRHGAWSDAALPPQRPPGTAVPDMLNPNLSATAIAALGLEAAGRRDAAGAAETFILRCQNWRDDSPACSGSFDDGGFFFALDDPIRSKAGSAGRDSDGRLRLRSYGSATCDGIMALLALGYSINNPRVTAGLRWLRDATTTPESQTPLASRTKTPDFQHPGDWPAERADCARALIFYYAHALGPVLQRCSDTWTTPARAALTANLAACQRPDGSWSNPDSESCEDDPLVATAFALSGLRS